jgi:hypothetical protein
MLRFIYWKLGKTDRSSSGGVTFGIAMFIALVSSWTV